MKQKIPPFEVGEDDPFENDRLGRKEEILTLTPMIKNITSPVVMAVNSPWGMGKTAFIKMWNAYLQKEGVPSLCFNAWETDFASDPFVPFMGEMEKQMSGFRGKSKQFQTAAWTAVKRAAESIVPVFADIGVAGIAGAKAGEVAGKLASKTLETYQTDTAKIAKFKGALEKFTDSGQSRVVVFVDELDRCRPDYAVKTLERIKHLFDVPGLAFVLAIDREQLCHSINGLYGANLDSQTYLRRFVDFDYALKKPDMGVFLEFLLSSLQMGQFFKERYSYDYGRFRHDKEWLLETSKLLMQLYDYSLRDAEQFLLRISLVLCALGDTVQSKYFFHPALLPFLILARRECRGLYDNYIQPDNSAEEIIAYWEDKLKFANILQDKKSNHARVAANITAELLVTKKMSDDEQKLGPYSFDADESMVDYKKIVRERINRIHDSSEFPRDRWLTGIVKKIEMLDQFHL